MAGNEEADGERQNVGIGRSFALNIRAALQDYATFPNSLNAPMYARVASQAHRKLMRCQLVADILRSRLWMQCWTAVVAFSLFSPAVANDNAKRLTGTEFQNALDQIVAIHWAEIELREATERLANLHNISTFLDRRIDPDQTIEFNATDVTLLHSFQALAESRKFGVGYFGGVVYLGPAPTASRLATVAAIRAGEISELPMKWRSRLSASKPLKWNEPGKPRELIRELATAVELNVVDLDVRIPHDIWASGNLPSMSWSDRMSLLLSGFDLTFVLDTNTSTVRLVPIPESVQVTKAFAVKGAVGPIAQRIKAKHPQLEIEGRDAKIRVTGRVEHVDQVGRELGRKSPPKDVRKPSEPLYDLRVMMKSFNELAREIARQSGHELIIAPTVPTAKLEQRVTFEVKDATLEKLVQAACKQAGLNCKVSDKQIEILP